MHYTASGIIITLIGGRLVHRLREGSLNLCTRRPPTVVDTVGGKEAEAVLEHGAEENIRT